MLLGRLNGSLIIGLITILLSQWIMFGVVNLVEDVMFGVVVAKAIIKTNKTTY